MPENTTRSGGRSGVQSATNALRRVAPLLSIKTAVMDFDLSTVLPLSWATLGSFLIAALIITITPGPDTALTLRNTLVFGRRGGIETAVGASTGMFVHTFAVVFGVAALLAFSVTAFTIFKAVGAAYLFWLGILAFREAFRRAAPTIQGSAVDDGVPSVPAPFVALLQRWGPARLSGAPYAQGVVSAITNPKLAVFMLTFLPQYLNPSGFVIVQAILLTILLAIVNISWLTGYVYAIGLFAPFLRRPRVRRVQEGLLGAVFTSFGVRLATATQ